MNEEDFEKKMEGLKAPQVNPAPPLELKLAILNADRSAAIGIWFIIVPYFFLACIAMKYFFHFNLGFLDIFEDAMSSLDKNPGTWWISPVLLVGLPITGIIMNALAITHFRWEKSTQLITVSVKLRWYNLVILFFSLAVVAVFILYLIVENFQARPGH